MKKYTDIYGMYHEDEVTEERPFPNDDTMIHSAYAHMAGLPIDTSKIREMIKQCKQFNGYPIERIPNRSEPFPSRDYWLGFSYFFPDEALAMMESTGWKFVPVETPNFSFVKTLASFILAMGEHRTFLWKHDLRHAFGFMFSVPFQDRAFYYRKEKKTPLFYRLYNFIDSKFKHDDDISGVFIQWLKNGKKPTLAQFEENFGMDHPITTSFKGDL